MFDDIKMFGDLKSAAGVKALNEFLAEHSYIEGYELKKLIYVKLIS